MFETFQIYRYQTIRKRKAVRPWYYDANEHYYFEIKVGLKSMELEKGKTAIDVGPKDKLLDVIGTIIKAVEKGELGMATLKALAGHFDPEQRLAPGVLLQD